MSAHDYDRLVAEIDLILNDRLASEELLTRLEGIRRGNLTELIARASFARALIKD